MVRRHLYIETTSGLLRKSRFRQGFWLAGGCAAIQSEDRLENSSQMTCILSGKYLIHPGLRCTWHSIIMVDSCTCISIDFLRCYSGQLMHLYVAWFHMALPQLTHALEYVLISYGVTVVNGMAWFHMASLLVTPAPVSGLILQWLAHACGLISPAYGLVPYGGNVFKSCTCIWFDFIWRQRD